MQNLFFHTVFLKKKMLKYKNVFDFLLSQNMNKLITEMWILHEINYPNFPRQFSLVREVKEKQQ